MFKKVKKKQTFSTLYHLQGKKKLEFVYIYFAIFPGMLTMPYIGQSCLQTRTAKRENPQAE